MSKEKPDLKKFLRQTPVNKFPGHENYALRFDSLEDYLNRHVHTQIPVGAALTDGNYLNDHGPGHVAAVIEKASRLTESWRDISPHEVYLLLSAIHVHDVGNFYGRQGHEQIPQPIRAQIDEKLSRDTPEQRVIYRIAAAHGGSLNGNRDKISKLPEVEPILGTQVKTRFLAALLRFADELADDMTRASRFALETGGILQGSEAYHQFSRALHPIFIDLPGQTLHVNFETSIENAKKRFPKGTEEVYLIDEILTRTAKMHLERIYCMRFLRPRVNIDRIKVNVKIVASDVYAEDIENIPYELEEQGYPTVQDAATICPRLNQWRERGVSGQNVCAFLNEMGVQ